jgi:hypothetical protein
MRAIAPIVTLFCTALPSCAQQLTLGETLQKLGIPPARFTQAERSERVVGMDAKNGSATYFVYVRGDEQSAVDAAPRLVRFDAGSGTVLRNNLNSKDIESCCGTAPLEIAFTHSYLLASFHLNPSASIVLVADKHLHYKATLYGIDFREIAPDTVAYVEDQVHFAPQHPSRLALADLRTGIKQELYPSKNDPLRKAFADMHEKHMPPQPDCQQANDPCDPDVYDEDIEFVDPTSDGFRIRVTRRAEHDWVTKDAVVEVPFQIATYRYRRTASGWMYCAAADSAIALIKSTDGALPAGKAKSCVPNLRLMPEAAGEFSPRALEKK